jgi:hypothetical protein
VEGGWLERAAVAPAFGIAVVALGGVVGDRLGVGLEGAPAVALLAVIAVAGWALAAWPARIAARAGQSSRT